MPGAWRGREQVTGLRLAPTEGMAGAMNRRSTAAGGIFLFLGLLIGAIYGVSSGQPMLWLLRGFGIGIVLAVLVWLIDRWRG